MTLETVEVWLADATLGPESRVGTLHRGKGTAPSRFVYDPAWINLFDAGGIPFALDNELPLASGDHYPAQGTLHRVFLDMVPDRWGQVLMDQREAMDAREEKRAKKQLREFDYLLGVADSTRMGALRLRDPATGMFIDASVQTAPPVTRLREIQHIAEEVQKKGAADHPEIKEWLRLLVQPGSALGGARPKAVFLENDGSMWLAKFPSPKDKRDWGRWEYLAHHLAIKAGIEMPPAQLLDLSEYGHTFVVQRFDRPQDTRRMYCSAMTLLSKNDGADVSYYWEIADAISRCGDLAHRADDLAQLYRRIYFSLLIANRDDHLRNHGFLRTEKGWKLSPAFDINPNPDKDFHSLMLGDDEDPNPSSALLRPLAAYYFPTHKTKSALSTVVAEVEQQVREAVSQWKPVAERLGMARSEIQDLETVIDIAR